MSKIEARKPLPRQAADSLSSSTGNRVSLRDPRAHHAARHGCRGNGGGASRDRTDDLKLAKLALSQLSYGPAGRSPKLLPFAQARWWAEKELNLRPHAYQACALTT